jgi:hypothetical protein
MQTLIQNSARNQVKNIRYSKRLSSKNQKLSNQESCGRFCNTVTAKFLPFFKKDTVPSQGEHKAAFSAFLTFDSALHGRIDTI